MTNIANLGLIGWRKWLGRSRVNLCHLQQVLFEHILLMFHNNEVITVMIFTIRCSLNWFDRKRDMTRSEHRSVKCVRTFENKLRY